MIRSALSHREDLGEVWGFGSYFRDEPYDDIDVVVVVQPPSSASTYEDVLRMLRPAEEALGTKLDVTVLTPSELAQNLFNDPLERIL